MNCYLVLLRIIPGSQCDVNLEISNYIRGQSLAVASSPAPDPLASATWPRSGRLPTIPSAISLPMTRVLVPGIHFGIRARYRRTTLSFICRPTVISLGTAGIWGTPRGVLKYDLVVACLATLPRALLVRPLLLCTVTLSEMASHATEIKMASNVGGKPPSSVDDTMVGKEEQDATVDTQLVQYTPEEEKVVLRKIDFVVLPFVSITSLHASKSRYSQRLFYRCASSSCCNISTSSPSVTPLSSA